MKKLQLDLSDCRAVDIAAAAGQIGVLKYLLDLIQSPAQEGRISSFYDLTANRNQ